MYVGTKRKVFIAYHHANQREVDAFVDLWATREGVFIPKVLGVSDDDDFINSTDADYVMSQIRQRYLGDSTVTIVLLGKCTHSRRYVDWELKSSLRQGATFIPNGLIGILLPSAQGAAHLPPRFALNWQRDEANCYARYRSAPSTAYELGAWIEDAFNARQTRARLIDNPQDMMRYNAKCQVCGVTH